MGGGAGAGVIGFEAVSSSLLQQQRGGGASATVMTPGNGSTNEASSLGAAGGGGGGEEVSHGSGSKFQVVMKQLGKKDTTTKLKVRLYGFNVVAAVSGYYRIVSDSCL